MSLDGLLAFVAILIGIYAILGPEQRIAFRMFFPLAANTVAILSSLTLALVPEACKAYGCELPQVALFWCKLGSFMIPGVVLGGSLPLAARRRLHQSNADRFREVLAACSRENRFDEAHEILRRNLDRPNLLQGKPAELLFEPAIVRGMLDSRSLVHLELLADLGYLKCLPESYAAVDSVIRELLSARHSPLRNAVILEYGGSDERPASAEEEAAVARTLQNPEWFLAASAHHPLFVASMKFLQSGAHDIAYNQPDVSYVTTLGRSSRLDCVLHLATRTHVLATKRAVERHCCGNYCLTDLLQVFREVLRRSHYDKTTWHDESVPQGSPTPYAYILEAIADDLRSLAADAAGAGLDAGGTGRGSESIPQQVAHSWAWCVCAIAQEQGNVSSRFRDAIIKAYLKFALCLKHAPYDGEGPGIVGSVRYDQEAWYDLFVNKLIAAFRPCPGQPRGVLFAAVESLDIGKRYVQDGRAKLQQRLTEGLARPADLNEQ